MNPSDMQLFCAGSTFFMKLPDGTFFSVSALAEVKVIEELPSDAKRVKPYPETWKDEPPSVTRKLMKAALLVAEHFVSKHTPTSTEEKGA